MTWWERLFSRSKAEQKLNDELEFHVDQLAQSHMREGMSEAEARRKARLDFGGLEHVKEECRDSSRIRFVEQTWQDLGYAVRMLRRNPGFASVVLLSLAIGIGANVAVFSVIEALLLKELPVSAPHELASFTWTDSETQEVSIRFLYQEFEQFRARSKSYVSLFAYAGGANTELRLLAAFPPQLRSAFEPSSLEIAV